MLFKFLLFMIIISNNVAIHVRALGENEGLVPLVKSSERKSVLSTENGEISSVRVTDGTTGSYLLQFITLEPNSLFLPVALHSDMLFYVHTGSGKLGWMDENEQKTVDLHIGDVFRLSYGSIFFLESNLEPTRQKLRVYSIFANSEEDLREQLNEPYSSIRNMILGFDSKVLQEAFHVPEDVIEEVLAGTEVPAIVHGVPQSTKKQNSLWEMEAQFVRTVLGRDSYSFFDNKEKKKKKKKKKSSKVFNVFQEKPDFENCNGWSTVIDSKKMHALTGSQIGVYVVNLTKGSMMGPHWNPMATEIGIAIQGEGMVRVVCSNTGTGQGCKNMRFKVEEGDVFVVPRFHPMAQMSFINNSFVFVGFSTTTKKHHPQYLAGKASVLRTLDRHILEASFNVTNTTMDQFLEAQSDSVILECTSCAEEEKRLMEEEMKREEEETRRKEEEEEQREKEEEEARKAEEERKEKEAEEERKRKEEAAKEKEEERKRQQEAERKREEEEAKKQEEEIRRRQEEEERERQEAEEARKRQVEEEAAARKREEEEAKRQEEEIRRRQEEEEAKKKEEEEERERQEAEESRKRQEEEEAEKRRQEEEEPKRQEEEEERERQDAEEARKRQEKEEEEARRREEEEAARRQQEEEAQREAEEARKGEEEAEKRKQEEEARRSEEEKQRQAEEKAQREAEESRRREEEEAAKKEREEETEGEAEEARKKAARKQEEEAQREAEEARRKEEAETRRKQEEEGARRQEEEEEAARRSEEEEAKESEKRGQQEPERQEEEARRQEEERKKRHQEEETEKEEPGGHEQIFLKSSMINGVHA